MKKEEKKTSPEIQNEVIKQVVVTLLWNTATKFHLALLTILADRLQLLLIANKSLFLFVGLQMT